MSNYPKTVVYPTLLAYCIKRALGVQPYAIAQFRLPTGVHSQLVRV